MLEAKIGFIIFKISGEAVSLFIDEAGAHRFQRSSPTEKRGRIHTSTITVAVLEEPTFVQLKIQEKDLDWATCRGSGQRGDKRRTIRCQDGIVTDHITGAQYKFKDYERGNW